MRKLESLVPNGSGPMVAVVGCGQWGKNHVRNFQALKALGMVCEATEEGRKTANDLAPGVAQCCEVADVFKSEIPAVVIATPAETHFELTRVALEAGKDVLVEKPMALDYRQAERLVRLAAERQRILMIGHVLEYHPAIVALERLVASGELGKIHYIYSTRLSLGKVRREENILWSFAPHDIAIILRLMRDLPFQVAASGGSYIQPNVADVTVTNLLFDNGVRAHIHVSWLHPFKEQRLVVLGSKKMASFCDVSKQLLLYDQRVEIQNGQPVPIKAAGQAVNFPAHEPLQQECQAFLDAIRSRRPSLTDGPSGLRVLQVLQAAQRSMVTNGEPVSLTAQVFDESQLPAFA